MIVGILKVNLNLQGVTSLKGKRSIVKGLKGRLQSRFNVTVSEVEHLDSKNVAVVGIAVVSNDGRYVDQQLDSIINFMRADGRFYLGPMERESFPV